MTNVQYQSDTKLIEILDRYSGVTKNGTMLCKLAKAIENPETIIPILGMQGMGKSTLLNAILSEDILPSDADETTCVPVEIRYSTNSYAEVHFLDNCKPSVKAKSKADLAKYVDNVCNPGNEKRVSHIILYRQLPLLKNGLVLVDLPGVGSMTEENQKTTMRYIESLHSAIFIIPTVPTIRKQDSIFIKSVWKAFNSCFFVQNPFDDESQDTIAESIEYNQSILQKIADEIHTTFDGKIIAVNAYRAICGRLQHNNDMMKSSNLPELLQLLESLSQNRKKVAMTDFEKRVHRMIDDTRKSVELRLQQVQMSHAELVTRLQQAEEEYRKSSCNIDDEIEGIKDFLRKKSRELRRDADTLSRNIEENFRADINRVIDNGVVDGDRLTSAFRDLQEKYIGVAGDEIFDIQQEFLWQLEEKMESLAKMIELDKNINCNFSNVHVEEKVKFEKGIEVGLNIGGGVGGIIAVARIGAALGTAIPVPVVGKVIGFIAGAAIDVVASLLGRGSKKAIISERASQAKQQIEPMVCEFSENVADSIKNKYKDTISQIEKQLDAYLEQRQMEAKEIHAQNEAIIKGESKIEGNEPQLAMDIQFLKTYTSV